MFLSTLGAAGLLPGAAVPKGSVIELRYYQLRNSNDKQMDRISEFIEKQAMPAARRAGSKVAGVFANLVAPNGPFVLMVNSYSSLRAMEEEQVQLASDAQFTKALEAYYTGGGLVYQRVEVTLLRAFDAVPQIDYPPVESGKPPRVFELRTYESNNASTLRRKVKMFEEGEIGIFRRLGMKVIFFGTTIAGTNMPNLTYMLGYDDLSHRDKVWKAFGADPEWQKMRAMPGYADVEIVSNISNILLRPLPFSNLR